MFYKMHNFSALMLLQKGIDTQDMTYLGSFYSYQKNSHVGGKDTQLSAPSAPSPWYYSYARWDT